MRNAMKLLFVSAILVAWSPRAEARSAKCSGLLGTHAEKLATAKRLGWVQTILCNLQHESRQMRSRSLRFHFRQRDRLMLDVARLGRSAIPGLVRLAGKGHLEQRLWAARGIGYVASAGKVGYWSRDPKKAAGGVAVLVEMLKAPELKSHVVVVADALARMGPSARSAVPQLMKLLMARAPAGNSSVLPLALGRAGMTHAQAKTLLEYSDEAVVSSALLALSYHERPGDGLLPLLKRLGRNPRHRCGVARALSRYPNLGTEWVKPLTSWARSTDCLEIAYALANVRPVALKALKALLSVPSESVRYATAWEIENLGTRASPLLGTLLRLLAKSEPDEGYPLASAIGAVAAPRPNVLRALQAFSKRAAWGTEQWAAMRAAIRLEGTLPTWVQKALEAPDDLVYILDGLPEPKVTPFIPRAIEAMVASNHFDVERGAHWLRRNAPAAAVEKLAVMVSDNDEREAAIALLAELGELARPAVPQLLELPKPPISALARIGGPKAAAAVLEALRASTYATPICQDAKHLRSTGRSLHGELAKRAKEATSWSEWSACASAAAIVTRR